MRLPGDANVELKARRRSVAPGEQKARAVVTFDRFHACAAVGGAQVN
jgi:hypothetical protein